MVPHQLQQLPLDGGVPALVGLYLPCNVHTPCYHLQRAGTRCHETCLAAIVLSFADHTSELSARLSTSRMTHRLTVCNLNACEPRRQ